MITSPPKTFPLVFKDVKHRYKHMFNFLGVFDQLIVVKHAPTGELF